MILLKLLWVHAVDYCLLAALLICYMFCFIGCLIVLICWDCDLDSFVSVICLGYFVCLMCVACIGCVPTCVVFFFLSFCFLSLLLIVLLLYAM